MLFLCKRSVSRSGLFLAAFLGLALALRWLLGTGPPVAWSARALGAGLVVCGVVLLSDGMFHQCLGLTLGAAYRRRFLELAFIFRGQTTAAIFAGALLAGLGEEPLFRGISTNPIVLAIGAVVFGLLHHIRRGLWPFTLWSIYEGLLFAVALYVTQNLVVVMVAHFLHDLTGFCIFRRIRADYSGNQESISPPAPPPGHGNPDGLP